MKLSTRLSGAMVTLVLLTAAVLGIITYRTIEGALVPRALERVETQARQLSNDLDDYVQGARADIVAIRSAASLEAIILARVSGGIHPADGTTETYQRLRMARRYMADLSAKSAYYQLRTLDHTGREIVRVDRSAPGGAVRVVPDTEMQVKSAETFFRETSRLREHEVYVSPIDLHREHGAIETPHVPVLRIATPVFDHNGVRFGLVMVNLDMRSAFDRLRSAARAGGHVYVVNESGDYLVHPDPTREFGFDLGRPSRLQDDFPDLTALLGTKGSHGRVVSDAGGERLGVAISASNPAGGPWIGVIETSPYSVILEPANAVRHSVLLASLAAVLVAIGFALWLSRSLARPVVQITRTVEAFGRGELAVPPVSVGGEIGTLAHAFERMADEMQEKNDAIGREMAARRRLFDTSLDLILIADRRGNFLQISPSAKPILGYEPEQLIGLSAAGFVHPEDLQRTREQMRMARRGNAIRNFESRYVHADGRAVPLAWTGVWSEPEQQHFFIGRDMTEQRVIDKALKQSMARQEAVFNCALYGIVTLNESGSIETLNPAAEKMFGVHAEEAVRRDIGRLIDLAGPSDVGSGSQLRHMLKKDGVCELSARRPDGTTFPVDFVLAEMPIGERKMFVVFVRDITTRKRTEGLKDEFVATVSHELRTPMTSIAGSLGLLVGGAAGSLPDPAKRLLTIAHNNSQRLVRLINDILDIEKIESGKMVFALQPVELRALIEQAIEANRGFAEAFGVTVRLDPSSAQGVVRVDSDRMTQVIINLLSNAVKFSPRGEEVLVGVEHNGTNLRVTVRDRGPGIPDGYKIRIFEKFVQVDATDARQKGGTGLGLSIVKQIMTRLGGDVGLQSAPGEGSVFYVELPCWDQIELLETERLGRSGNALILLCEDDPDAAAVLSGRLRAAGFPTDVAYTADEAVKGAASRSYAAILVDLQLPDSDGISLIKNLRAQPQYHNTPIVVVSADPARGRDDKRSSTLNVLDWLAKPVDTERLLRVLNRPIVRDSFVRPRILHVDDDRDVLRMVALALGSTAEVVSAESIDEARHLLEANHFDLAVLDVTLAEGFGLAPIR